MRDDVRLRPATDDDLELMLAWRSQPAVYEHAAEQDGPLSWSEHADWWQSREDREDWIVTVSDGDRRRAVGVMALSDLDTDCPEIHVYIGEVSAWGDGIGRAAIQRGCEEAAVRGHDAVEARIAVENDRSRYAFHDAGFVAVRMDDDGLAVYRREVDA